MTLTLAAGITLMRSATARTHHGASWHNQCGSFVCCMVSGIDSSGSGIGDSRPTAREALAASGPIVSTDPSKATPGDIGWWSNGTGDGHVAVYIGSGLWAMGSDAVTATTGTVWGDDSGTILLPTYNRLRPDMRWVGFTHDYVGQMFKPTPLPAPVAAPKPAALPATPLEEDLMPIYFKGDKSSSVYVYNPYTGTRRHISHPEYNVVVGGGVKVVHVAQADADAIPDA